MAFDLKEISCCGGMETIEQDLRNRAYFLWEQSGKPDGRDLEFWCEAERATFGYTCGEYRDAINSFEQGEHLRE
jgi:hypothetical protein